MTHLVFRDVTAFDVETNKSQFPYWSYLWLPSHDDVTMVSIFNPSSAGSIDTTNINLVSNVATDVLASNGARPSADTVLTTI